MAPGDLSPFSGYLGTNNAPTAEVLKDLQANSLQGLVQDPQQVDDEIEEITHRLSALYSERGTNSSFITTASLEISSSDSTSLALRSF
jgi:hypothetical protein